VRFERNDLGSIPSRFTDLVSCFCVNNYFFNKVMGFETNMLYFTFTFLFILSLSFVFFVGYNFFLVLVYMELSALSVSSLLVIVGNAFDSFYSEFFAVTLITVVGAESAIAISILILAVRQGLDLNVHKLSLLKGLCIHLFYLDHF
jgi:NADH:ubiquinone oxidoreductase subunit K